MGGGLPLRCGRPGDSPCCHLAPAARVAPAFRAGRRAFGCGERRGARIAVRAGHGDSAEESADGSASSIFDNNPQFSSVFKSVMARQGKSGSDSDEPGRDASPADRASYSSPPRPERKQSAVEEVLQSALNQSQRNLRRLDELRQQLEAATQQEEVQYDRIEFALQRTTADAAYIATLNELRLDDQQKLFDFELEIQRLLEELHGPGQAPPASFEQPRSYGGQPSSYSSYGSQEGSHEEPGSWRGEPEPQPQYEEPQHEEPQQQPYSWAAEPEPEPQPQQHEEPSYSWQQPEREAEQPGRSFSWDAPADSQEPEAAAEPEPEPELESQPAASGYSRRPRSPGRTFAWDEPEAAADSAAPSSSWRAADQEEEEEQPPQQQQQEQQQQEQQQRAAAYEGGATYSWRGRPADEPEYSWRKSSQPGWRRWANADDEESDAEDGYSSSEAYSI